VGSSGSTGCRPPSVHSWWDRASSGGRCLQWRQGSEAGVQVLQQQAGLQHAPQEVCLQQQRLQALHSPQPAPPLDGALQGTLGWCQVQGACTSRWPMHIALQLTRQSSSAASSAAAAAEHQQQQQQQQSQQQQQQQQQQHYADNNNSSSTAAAAAAAAATAAAAEATWQQQQQQHDSSSSSSSSIGSIGSSINIHCWECSSCSQ
jgi:hypothetical protein